MRYLIIYITIPFIYTAAKCSKEDTKNPLPFFRRLENELLGKSSTDNTKDDSQSKIVSIFVNNIKEIFEDISDTSVQPTTSPANITTTTVTINETNEESSKLTDDNTYYENSTIINDLVDEDIVPDLKNKETEQNIYKLLPKDMKSMEKIDQISDNNILPSPRLDLNKTNERSIDIMRSCISCDNIKSEDCHDPRNKLIAAVRCERDDDLCYSQHTPFGVIDRGCFNVNHNLTTYVCCCNLCNYISISEMPYIFSNKRDWVDNVVELSRTRNFRKSVFKDMACLRCEVNTTARGDILDSANCLEGNIASLPTETCKENEICAVKAVRSDGYVWRGCVNTPLYNYWWALCDSDLCNYEALISIYDFL